MLNNTNLINRITAITGATALILAFVFGAIQINKGAAEGITLYASLTEHCVTTAVFGICAVLLIQTVLSAVKNRQVLKKDYRQIIELLLFACLMSALLILSATFFQNTPSVYIMATQLLMLAFVPYIVFVADFTETGNLQKIILCGVSLLNFLVQNITALMGFAGIYDMQWITNLINMSILAICSYNLFKSEENKKQNIPAVATLLFAVFCGFEIIVNINGLFMLLLGFTIWVACINMLTSKAINKAQAEIIAEDISHNYALTDYQTGFGSRLAFNEYYYNLGSKFKGNVSVAVLVVDINNLKDVNDRYGNTVGDKLITDAAQCITKVFTGAECFRTGGDEFAVVAINSALDMETLMYGLDTVIMEYNLAEIHQISIARGLCIDNAEVNDEKKLHIIYKAADDRMYKDKIQKHEQLKVKMIQETYLKKQMLQEQMIKEKHFQKQMEKVAEAKLAEDQKKGITTDKTPTTATETTNSQPETATADTKPTPPVSETETALSYSDTAVKTNQEITDKAENTNSNSNTDNNKNTDTKTTANIQTDTDNNKDTVDENSVVKYLKSNSAN